MRNGRMQIDLCFSFSRKFISHHLDAANSVHAMSVYAFVLIQNETNSVPQGEHVKLNVRIECHFVFILLNILFRIRHAANATKRNEMNEK